MGEVAVDGETRLGDVINDRVRAPCERARRPAVRIDDDQRTVQKQLLRREPRPRLGDQQTATSTAGGQLGVVLDLVQRVPGVGEVLAECINHSRIVRPDQHSSHDWRQCSNSRARHTISCGKRELTTRILCLDAPARASLATAFPLPHSVRNAAEGRTRLSARSGWASRSSATENRHSAPFGGNR